jgi:lysophospholipid acyltransferase (LPLAT)-like uncharacterized protein
MYIGWELSLVQGEDQLVPWRTRLTAWTITVLVRLLRRTWRVRFHDRALFEDAIGNGAAVFAFWHGEQLPMVPLHASGRVAGLASRSSDGTLIAEVLHHFGYQVVRGSGSSGGPEAHSACEAVLKAGISPALAVDGPRGPFHHVHTGAVRLAAESPWSVIYVVSHVRHAIRLGSWDKFQIPLPGARVDVAYGKMDVDRTTAGTVHGLSRALGEKMEALADELKRPSSSPLVD